VKGGEDKTVSFFCSARIPVGAVWKEATWPGQRKLSKKIRILEFGGGGEGVRNEHS